MSIDLLTLMTSWVSDKFDYLMDYEKCSFPYIYGWICVGMSFFGWVWVSVTFFWLGVGECDFFWLSVGGCWWVWLFLGWVWVGVGECGWVWMSARFITSLFLWAIRDQAILWKSIYFLRYFRQKVNYTNNLKYDSLSLTCISCNKLW